MTLDSEVQQFPLFFNSIIICQRGLIGLKSKIPILFDRYFFVFTEKIMTSRNLINILKHGCRGRDKFKADIVVQRLMVDLPVNGTVCKDSFYFGSKDESAIFEIVIEGFYANTISSKKEAVLNLIIYGKGKHSPEFLQYFNAILFIAVNDNF